MEALLDVISVEPRRDSTLLLVFENGERRIFDMSHLLNKRPFHKLKDSKLFFEARVDGGTVIWPGNIDIAPETLFDQSTLVSTEIRSASKI